MNYTHTHTHRARVSQKHSSWYRSRSSSNTQQTFIKHMLRVKAQFWATGVY